MASDVEKELKEEEKEVRSEKSPSAGGEMQMEAPPRSIRWGKMAKAGLLIIVVGALFLFIGYKYGKESGNEATETAATETAVTADDSTTTVASASATTDATAGWKTYSNTTYGYTFKYPSTDKLTASGENSYDLAISATAAGVNVFPVDGTVADGMFYVSAPNIDFTAAAINSNFSATKPENIAITPTTIAGSSAFKVIISGDSSVVSTFYFVQSPSGTVLLLTVLNNSTDASSILSTFQFTK